MSDLNLTFSGDVAASAAGDLLTTDALTEATQRVLRRLLTNPGDYLWHPEYGAGLPARIGSALDVDELAGLVRTQMLLEDGVARDPEPQVTLTPVPDGVKVTIRFALSTGQESLLNFTVTP